jgi:Uri superfamily endonuclease
MKGTYCLLIQVQREEDIEVGALGVCRFEPGMYAYVGSALSGIEQRVSRHRRSSKRRRWHIDYLLDRGEVLATVVVPTGVKSTECSVANALLACGEAKPVVPGFGSSDCGCPSHLMYFGDVDAESAAEAVSLAISMLKSAYRRTVDD